MSCTNSRIAAVFNEIADLLDIEGANPFRIRAYRNAARTVYSYPKEMAALVEEGFDLTTIGGIGKDLAGKITELVRTGELKFLSELKEEVSPELEALIKIPGLGPKRVQTLHEKLHVNSMEDLKKALEDGTLESLRGFGPKLVTGIEKALEKKLFETRRYRLFAALPVARWAVERLKQTRGILRMEIAGSLRRRRDTVKDIDIVVSCRPGSNIMEVLTALPGVEKVLMKGTTRSSVALGNGLHIDLRVVPEEAFTSALHHFTGSKPHNVALRLMARKAGMKINEYGIFKADRRIPVKEEADIYRALGLTHIEPELRENRGEIEAARQNTLPKLIDEKAIRGDLHLHTTYTDGKGSIREMALAAKARGYEYIAVTDHTRHLTIAHGLDEKRIRQQLEEIDRLNGELKGITVLKSAEVDILADGSLDLPDTVLKELDLTVCAVHYRMNLSKEEQTARILKAMQNPYFNILAHPTGRLINLREPYELDMEAIIKACSQNGIILELNAQPDRLDLNDIHCKMAKEAGVKVAISTDAHSVNDLGLMTYGIGQARRGWLEKEDVVNTRSLEALKKLLRR